MRAEGPTKAILFLAYGALLLLLTISAAGAFLPIGQIEKTLLALGVAAAKTTVIFMIFMQLRYQRGVIRVFAVAGFFWLLTIIVLTFADYLTRGQG